MGPQRYGRGSQTARQVSQLVFAAIERSGLFTSCEEPDYRVPFLLVLPKPARLWILEHAAFASPIRRLPSSSPTPPRSASPQLSNAPDPQSDSKPQSLRPRPEASSNGVRNGVLNLEFLL